VFRGAHAAEHRVDICSARVHIATAEKCRAAVFSLLPVCAAQCRDPFVKCNAGPADLIYRAEGSDVCRWDDSFRPPIKPHSS
jgi:hypothetical protein